MKELASSTLRRHRNVAGGAARAGADVDRRVLCAAETEVLQQAVDLGPREDAGQRLLRLRVERKRRELDCDWKGAA
jgi:hypothetical protein